MQNQILFVTLFLCYLSIALTIKCNRKAVDQLDENVMILSVLGDPNRRYPSNDQQAQTHCQEDTKITDWNRNYSVTCMPGKQKETSRSVTSLLTYSMKAVSKKRCRSEATRKVFIMAGKCGNLVQSETVKCYNEYSSDSEQINRFKSTTNEKHLLPLICCAYHKFYDCCSDAYSQPSNAKTCPEKATVELEGYIRESMYDVIQYLCGNYQGSNDKCDRLYNQYKDNFSSERAKVVPKSPLGPSNEVFDSIPLKL